MNGFDFEEERIKTEIAKRNAKRVLLQMPQGLKPKATEISKIVEQTGALPIVSIDPCYGACDLALHEAEEIGADLIVHFGHALMMKNESVPTLYVEARSDVSVEEVVVQALPLLSGYQKIGLATSVQHLQKLEKVKKLLIQYGKTVAIGDSKQIPYAGQVTGCNFSNIKAIRNEVEAFVFVGGGLFHALGIALSTNKPVIVADPYDNRAFLVSELKERTLKQRFAAIEESKLAKTFGILVGLKIGQKHLDNALRVRDLAERKGKAPILLVGREITPEVLLEFPSINAYVNTACPRISLEAYGKFSKPVLTVNEFMVVCGEVSWENLLKGGLFEN